MDKEILSFPFNSKLVDGKHDRVWDANDFARDRQVFIGNGIYPNPSDNLKVVSLYNNMRLTLKGGAAWIEGHSYVQGRIRNGVVDGIDIEVDITPNDTGTQRKDMIVLDCSLIRRDIQAVYVEGSTELIRNDDVFQIKLAEITVNPGVTSITQANITDTRLDKNVCGIMTNGLTVAEAGAEWQAGVKVSIEQIVTYENENYKCLLSHVTQADWIPSVTPALWEAVKEEYEEFKQPTGAYNAYSKGDKVTFNGKRYESLIDGNAHSPAAYPAGWKLID